MRVRQDAPIHPAVVAALLVLLLLCLGVVAALSADWVGIDAKVKEGIFRLEATQGENRSLCSAVLINKEYATKEGKLAALVTAGHCVPQDGAGRSLAVQGRHAEILKVNWTLDLAVLGVDGLKGAPLVRRTGDIGIGLAVAAVGHAFGSILPKYTFGYVSAVADEALLMDIQTPTGSFFNVVFIPGDSGGAVVDMDGHLVSIVQAGLVARGQMIGIGASPETLSEFAKDFWPKAATK